MAKCIIWTVIFSIIAAILQSTVFQWIAIFGYVPDIALCILVFSAYVNGNMAGQVSGFFSGLFYDFISAAPLGMNCLIRTIIGALTGIFKGSFFLDNIFLPIILCSIATILKAIIIFLLYLIIGSAIPVYSLTDSKIWIELGLNAFSSPLLFLLLKNFRPIQKDRR
ncbi:MAG: rod shape-determining protein MreD [Treponema sp.]|nr:rod shape-determining protein MreD [Treponema sp.]